MDNTKRDKVIEEVVFDLRSRSMLGIMKYGTTLADDPQDLRAWLQHAYEETLDNANYLKKAIMIMDEKAKEV